MAEGNTIQLMDGPIRPDDWNSVDHWKNMSLADIEGEVWVDISGYEGYYQVSNMGRVKGLERRIWNGEYHRVMASQIMSQSETDERGYVRAAFNKDGIGERQYVHILVGIYFIPNPKNKRTVNHLWGNKKDNRATSLEWATYGENHKHSYKFLGRKHWNSGNFDDKNHLSKKVSCSNGIVYGSVSEAARQLNLSFQNVSKVCKGKRHHTGGFVFKFIEQE